MRVTTFGVALSNEYPHKRNSINRISDCSFALPDSGGIKMFDLVEPRLDVRSNAHERSCGSIPRILFDAKIVMTIDVAYDAVHITVQIDDIHVLPDLEVSFSYRKQNKRNIVKILIGEKLCACLISDRYCKKKNKTMTCRLTML